MRADQNLFEDSLIRQQCSLSAGSRPALLLGDLLSADRFGEVLDRVGVCQGIK